MYWSNVAFLDSHKAFNLTFYRKPELMSLVMNIVNVFALTIYYNFYNNLFVCSIGLHCTLNTFYFLLIKSWLYCFQHWRVWPWERGECYLIFCCAWWPTSGSWAFHWSSECRSTETFQLQIAVVNSTSTSSLNFHSKNMNAFRCF